jgi:hypothetical protein
MGIKFKTKCIRCRKNYLIVTGRQTRAVCYDCQKPYLEGEIKDPALKKLFNLPEKYYKENSFLRDLKIQCLRFGKLSEKQIEALKKSIARMKEEEHPKTKP